MEKKEIAVLEKKVMPLVEAANEQLIESGTDMETATALLSNLGNYYDSVVETREKITAPLNASLKATRAMFDPIEKPAKAAIDGLRMRIGAWQTAETRRVAEEEERIAARVGEGKGKLKIETAARKAHEIEKPETAIHTGAGSLSFMSKQKLKITDEKKIPREFLMVDESAVLSALKEGRKVPGAEIEIVQIPRNSR